MRWQIAWLLTLISIPCFVLGEAIISEEGDIQAHRESPEVDPLVPVLPSATKEYVLTGHNRWQVSELFISRTVSLKCTRQVWQSRLMTVHDANVGLLA